MKSLEDLEKLKKEVLEKMKLRETEDKIKVVVGMGTCGIAAGAREVMTSILEELGKRNLNDVLVSQTGCIGMCGEEPLVDVLIPGKEKVTYGKVDPQKAKQIVAQHVVNGIVITDWLVNKIE
ncbi:(2Fe-2S) ferredoxin domain-containing protein [Zhaonella formicivorans]|uniref:(2Fe-2S) ferredoxin domain-containing protein n=1 Tax=Zhaonella formicivorans TaxID=2528593 RepID=UPI0010DE896C|nr:(2Fe-2S) ferredoxin domain-containing protein [Zhaonella formicivorans]